MIAAAQCPQRESLYQYSVGLLSDDQSEEIAVHVDRCTECQAELLTLSDAGDTLVGQLRTPVDEPCLREPRYDEAVAEALRAAPRPAADGTTEAYWDSRLTSGDRRVLGEYELLEELGRGGMGRVYKARHTKLDRIVAIKILPGGRLEDSRAIARFAREMRAIGQLDHPHVVHAYDGREIDEMPVLVMEYVEGMDLAELVRRLGRLRPADAAELVRQAAEGLQYAQQRGLVHRDIKPSNLMLTRGGTVKLLDLGLARFYAEPVGDEVTGTGQMMGTADYVAPEQVSDSRAADIRADIYSLGCTLYKLLSGRAPFAGDQYRTALDKMNAHVHQPAPPIGTIVPGIPPGLVAVLERMLAKQPEARFATPAEVIEAVRPFCAGADTASLVEQAEQRATATTLTELPPATEPPPAKPAAVAPAPLPMLTTLAARCHCSRQWLVATGVVLLLLGVGFAAGVMITIYKNGEKTQVEVPDGSQVRVGAEGDVEVTLPQTTGAIGGPSAMPADLQRMQGEWNVAELVQFGETSPQDFRRKLKWVFTDQHLKWQVDDHPQGVFEIRLNPSTEPKRIDLVQAGQTTGWGIYRFDGDSVETAYGDSLEIAYNTAPPRPTEFSPGQQKVVVSLKRDSEGEQSLADAEKLSGVWQVRFAEKELERMPSEIAASLRFVFDERRFQMWMGEAIGRQGTYELDPSADPKAITFHDTGSDSLMLGIYHVDEDRLVLAFNEIPGGPRPINFAKARRATGQTVLELRRSDEPRPALIPDEPSNQPSRPQPAEMSPLWRIGLAMHEYHDATKSFPPAVLKGPGGQTPYSWRVALLPYLGHDDLYQQYRRDEPWDSPHNLQLLDQIPDVYRAPGSSEDATNTAYFALVGPGALFPGDGESISLADVIDGAVHTILVVEARREIPWTKPEDIPYDAEQPLPELGGFRDGGFHAVFADGSVRFIPEETPEAQLRALISPAQGDRVEELPQRVPEAPRHATHPFGGANLPRATEHPATPEVYREPNDAAVEIPAAPRAPNAPDAPLPIEPVAPPDAPRAPSR